MTARPLRIAFVDYVLEPDKPGRSGLSDIVWDMASELVNQGHEAHIVASYATTNYPDPRVIVHNFPTPPIGYRNVVGHFWILKRAADIVLKIKPDVVHAPEYVSTAVLRALRVPIPLVLTVPGNIFYRLQMPGDSGYEWHFVQILKWAARVSARHCAAVIATSTEMKEWWERTGSRPEHTPTIPLGSDARRFHHISGAKQRLRMSNDALLLAYVGRFSPEKGVMDVVSALCKLRPIPRGEQLQVVMIGKGVLRDKVLRRIADGELDHIVRVLDWVPQDELALWYSAADAILLPSRSEAFGRVIGEAMLCGTPVVGSCVGGVADQVLEGETGLRFPAGDHLALADVLGRMIRDPGLVRSMRPKVHAYADQHLTWRSMTARVIEEVYKPLLKDLYIG